MIRQKEHDDDRKKELNTKLLFRLDIFVMPSGMCGMTLLVTGPFFCFLKQTEVLLVWSDTVLFPQPVQICMFI